MSTCRIRDLNDEINKLIREKGHWERRIVELGGPNYARTAPRLTDDEGNQVQGATGKGGGYKYFGAAKQLPGVRELFEKEAPRQIRRTRHQMYRHIDADYYGFRDDEDGVLVKVEGPAEKRMRTQVKQCCMLGLQLTWALVAAGDYVCMTAHGTYSGAALHICVGHICTRLTCWQTFKL